MKNSPQATDSVGAPNENAESRCDPEFERQIVLAREVLREQRDVLEALAKGRSEAADDA